MYLIMCSYVAMLSLFDYIVISKVYYEKILHCMVAIGYILVATLIIVRRRLKTAIYINKLYTFGNLLIHIMLCSDVTACIALRISHQVRFNLWCLMFLCDCFFESSDHGQLIVSHWH